MLKEVKEKEGDAILGKVAKQNGSGWKYEVQPVTSKTTASFLFPVRSDKWKVSISKDGTIEHGYEDVKRKTSPDPVLQKLYKDLNEVNKKTDW